MTVVSNYQSINEKLNELRSLLIEKLEIFIEVEEKKKEEAPFIELIEAIDNIKSVKTVTENNYKPTHMPEIDGGANLSTFNIMLYSRIRYYMGLLEYFLILKGVPRYEINAQTDLKGLIELVGTIKAVKPSTLSLGDVDDIQYFGVGIEVPYTLVDDSGEDIKEGNIIIRDDSGGVYDSVRAGEAIVITPLYVSNYITFTITYEGTNKYMPDSREFTVDIAPSKINLILTITNMSTSSRYYNSQTVGCRDDEWTISISTLNYQNKPLSDIPFNLSIDGYIILSARTNDDGVYVLDNQVIDEVGEHEIACETTCWNADEISDTSIYYTVDIKYNILKQDEDSYIDYAGKNNYTYQIEVIDENTGITTNQYDGQTVKVFLYEKDNEGIYSAEQIDTISIDNGEAICTIDSLTPGDKFLKWVFKYDNFSARITTTLNILSNFILPEKQTYFLNDTPTIMYDTNGIIEPNSTITGRLEYVSDEDVERTIIGYEQVYNEETGELEDALDGDGNPTPIYDDYTIVTRDITLTANENGKLDTISNYNNVGFYTLTLYSDNDLGEVCTWQYELKKPFDVEVVSYDKKQSIKYKVTIYDTSDNTNFIINNSVPNQISINNIITIQGVQISQLTNYSDDNSELHEYTYPTCILTIYKTDDFVKNNEIIFKHNAYQESFNFRFVNEIFTLSEETETVTLGEGTMKIKCNDSSVTSIDIESPDFEINNIVYDNNIFIIDAVFLKTGRISFIVTDDSLYSESLSIEVNKVDLMPYIDAFIYVANPQSSNTRDNNVGYEDLDRISVSFVIDNELYSDLPIIYTVEQYGYELHRQSFTYKADTAENDFTLTVPHNLTPDQYQINFRFESDDNYDWFDKTINFEVLPIYPNYEITNKYTNFKNHKFFIYKPDFTEENPESIKVNANSKTYSTQSNGIWESAGYYLEQGWANTGLWECDFDMSTRNGIKYIGVSILQQPYSGGYLIGGWEGPLATNPPGNYTRDNNNTLSVLNSSLSNDVPWCHINIKKTSPTTLTITKTGDNVNNGSVTYEWQELSNYPVLTFGTWAHNGQNIAYLKVKNFIVRGVY